MGESPTRPGSLPCMSPVEVAAARWPLTSRATAPTVPNRCENGRAFKPVLEMSFGLSGPGESRIPLGSGGISLLLVRMICSNSFQLHFCEEEALRLLLKTLSLRKSVRTRADHQHILRVLHDGPRQIDRMTREMNTSDTSAFQVLAVHDGRIHFNGSVCRKGRTTSRIKQRIIFENLNGSLHGVQRSCFSL